MPGWTLPLHNIMESVVDKHYVKNRTQRIIGAVARERPPRVTTYFSSSFTLAFNASFSALSSLMEFSMAQMMGSDLIHPEPRVLLERCLKKDLPYFEKHRPERRRV